MRAKLEKLLAPKQTVYVFSSHFRWNQGLGDRAGNKASQKTRLLIVQGERVNGERGKGEREKGETVGKL